MHWEVDDVVVDVIVVVGDMLVVVIGTVADNVDRVDIIDVEVDEVSVGVIGIVCDTVVKFVVDEGEDESEGSKTAKTTATMTQASKHSTAAATILFLVVGQI